MTGRQPTDLVYTRTQDGRPAVRIGSAGVRIMITLCGKCGVYCSVCSRTAKCCLEDPYKLEVDRYWAEHPVETWPEDPNHFSSGV